MASFERDRKDEIDRWRVAYAKRCTHSFSATAILLREMKERFDPDGRLEYVRV